MGFFSLHLLIYIAITPFTANTSVMKIALHDLFSRQQSETFPSRKLRRTRKLQVVDSRRPSCGYKLHRPIMGIPIPLYLCLGFHGLRSIKTQE
uniref:Uncharacterized protein n=1 Tax=Pyxicephalus adspersus TaxID=30357 RepID=A0AAV3AJT1_PYXAD|nr:TPA: hypothetical protein GDO54_008089 [Pyxicephalus adspersus]